MSHWGSFKSYLGDPSLSTQGNEVAIDERNASTTQQRVTLQSSNEYGVRKIRESTNDVADRSIVGGLPSNCVKQVACTNTYTIVLYANNEVWVWGTLKKRAERVSSRESIPRQMKNLRNVLAVACGDAHCCAIGDNSTNNLYTWGQNDFGQLGHASGLFCGAPKVVHGCLNRRCIVQVTCGPHSTFCVDAQSTVFAWGKNEGNQLGLSTALSFVAEPTQVNIGNGEILFQSQGTSVPAYYRQLMISACQQHAISWVSDSGDSLMSESQRATVQHLHEENANLQLQVDKLSRRVHQLEGTLAASESEQLDKLVKNSRSPEEVGNPESVLLNQAEPLTETQAVEALNLNDVVSRDMKQDGILLQVAHVIEFTEKKLADEERRIAHHDTMISQLQGELDRITGIVKLNKSRIRDMNTRIMQHKVELEELAHVRKIQKSNPKRQTTENLKSILAQGKEKLHVDESLVKAGEDSVALQLQDLNLCQAKLDRAVSSRADHIVEQSKWKSIRNLLVRLQQERREGLRRRHRETAHDVYQKLDEIANRALDDLRRTKLEVLARDPTLKEKLDKQHMKLIDLVALSDERIDHVVSEAHNTLQQHVDNAVDDAAGEVVATLLSAIQDIAQLRHEGNLSIKSRIKAASQSVLEKILSTNTSLCQQ